MGVCFPAMHVRYALASSSCAEPKQQRLALQFLGISEREYVRHFEQGL
jgi:hypothetical protein